MNQKNGKHMAHVVGGGVLDDPNIEGKTQKGITLIALVITIIVLLILAGVTISMVLGDDGIIAQAQQAKQAQEKADKKEQEEIQKGQGNIDLYTEGTLANKVKVGDYVKYTYTAPTEGYTTPDTTTESCVNSETQKFESSTGGNAQITAWRVLSKKDGIVKLVAETPINEKLTLNGAKGYLNGPDVLNEMCKTLYSSSIGTGRSINVEDVNEVTGYVTPDVIVGLYKEPDGLEAYDVAWGAKIKDYWTLSLDIIQFPGESVDVGDIRCTYYNYNGASQMQVSSSDGTNEYKLMFRSPDNTSYSAPYFLATTAVSDLNQYNSYVSFRDTIRI